MKKKQILIFFLLANALFAQAQQQIEWRVSMLGIGDNREFFYTPQLPQTILGARLRTEVGLSFDHGHKLMAGADYLHEYGAKVQLPEATKPVMYYEYNSEKYSFLAGLFPRHNRLDNYPIALLNDTLLYFRPNVEGMLAEVHLKNFRQHIWADWLSRQSETDHEEFMAGTSGRWGGEMLFVQNFGVMSHHAGTMIRNPNESIHDNAGISVGVGLDLSTRTVLDSLVFSVNYLNSFDRVRDDNLWHSRRGAYAQLQANYKRLGLYCIFYTGDSQQHTMGDLAYLSTEYGKVTGSYKLFDSKYVQGAFAYAFHFSEGQMNHQQMLNIWITLSGQREVHFD